MLKILLVLSLSHTAAVLVGDQPYCALRYRRLCQGKGRHVACQFPFPGPGMSCRNYTQIKFTSDLKHFIVHYINKRRQRIASGNEKVRGGVPVPLPEIMMLVSWDRELAKLAERLADQCSFVHDDCRATVRYPYAGQSVGEVRWRGAGIDGEGDAVSLGVQRALRRVLDAWWGERRRVYARQLVAPFRLTAKDMVWGHFSQLAVWSLRAVGCGAVRHGFEHTRMLLVCDFSHTNMLGQRTVTPGPLAPCPIHTVRRPRSAYPLLCAPVQKPILLEKDYKESIYGYDEDGGEDEEVEERTTKLTRLITRKNEKIGQKLFRLHYTLTRDGRARGRIEWEQGSTALGLPFSKRTTVRKYHQWETIRALEKSREVSGSEDYATFLKAKNKLAFYTDEDTKPDDGGKHTTRSHVYHQRLNSRHRWKEIRMRPQRPGVNALLKKPPTSEQLLGRSPVISLILDADDSDQLFRDTGFNAKWREQSKR
ncbi:uncharacterized protein LOC120634073 [Pararge aegeria]|uniref:uncharacterized protein LOC120634073 n=1 Tax=Pararge aegeria TaxID=116150 RepID=UPI0019D0A4B2|nr:uncharacterized protein LOC120634073 [Pararge aegeria]